MSFLINSYRFAADLDFLDTTSWFADGVDDQLLSTSDFRSIDNGTQFSWSFWFKLDTTTPSIQSLIRLNTNTSTQGFHVFHRGGSSLQLEAFVEGDASNWTRSGTGSIKEINKWYHVCVTLDNTDSNRYLRLKIYLDGVYQGASNFLSANMGTGTNLSFLSNVDGSAPTNGNIDEIACWGQGTVLTATQVQEIFNKGLANDLNNLPTAPAPTNWWRSETASWNGFAWTLTDVNASFELRSQNMLEANRENDVPSLFSNKSFSFDGVDDYIDCGQVTEIQNTNALSVSCWFNYDSINSSADGLVAKDDDSRIDGNWYVALQSDQVRFLLKTANGQDALNSTTLSSGTWYHTLCVWNGSTMSIYINGTLNNSISVSNATGTLGTALPQDTVKIGKRLPTSSRYNGRIDEVAVWNSDQSANITSIFNQGVPTSLESLNPISHWRMGEDATWNGTNWTLNDNGSGGNNGTSQNMVLASRTNDVPLFNTKSILFDGVDDRINFSSTFVFSGEFSFNWWMKPQGYATNSKAYIWGRWGTNTDFLKLENNSRLVLKIGGGTSLTLNRISGGNTIDLNVWSQICLTRDSSNNIKTYVNGDLFASASASTTLRVQTIGRIINNSFGFLGHIDEVSFFSRGLTQSEVTSIYNSGVPNDVSNISDLEAYYRLGDYDSYPTLIDRGSGNNNGTMTNMTSASIVDDVPQ